MKFIVVLFVVTCVQSGPVRTSLCCCGCTEEPCPVVGSNCPQPQLPCGTESISGIVYCSELQRLWEMANVIDKPVNNSQDEHSIIPFVGQTGKFNRFHGSVRKDNQSVISDRGVVQNDVVYRDTNSTSEIRFSPPKRTLPIVEQNLSSLEKMNEMLSDLQGMISTVKGLIDKEVAPKPGNLLLDEHDESLPPGADNITEEEERQAIDDVIRRMKGAFRKVTKDGPPVNEVDSSVSAPVVDVQSLSVIPMNTRPKRESIRISENCNDDQLREIIHNNISSDSKVSKRLIQKAAEKAFGGTFNVVCSPCEFSFVISSQKYCEGFKDQVACFVFLQPLTSLTNVYKS